MTRGRGWRVAAVVAWLALPALLAGQAAKPGNAGRPAAAARPVQASDAKAAAKPPSSPAPAPPATLDAYTYRSEGRRDPFVSLVNRGLESGAGKGGGRVDGVAGLLVNELILKGIVQSRGGFLAIVQGPDGKRPYIVHPNERFADGVVRAITADGLLILQEVNDPLSLTKQREIRKTLRAVEEVK